MKNNLSRLVLIGFDILAIYISILIAFYLSEFVGDIPTVYDYSHYTDKIIIYVLVITSFFGLRVYKYRHDFWEESYLVIKSLILSLFMLFSLISLSQSVDEYSNKVIIISFLVMVLVIPIFKYTLKSKLSVFGLWRKKASVVSANTEIMSEIFGNRYLGYVESDDQDVDVVFMDTAEGSKEHIESKLNDLVHEHKEIIFIPLLNSFNYTKAGFIEVFNIRTNMIVLENALLEKRNIILKQVVEIFFSILLIPLLIPIFGMIIFFMKREEPNGKIFFKQKRMGQGGKTFICYKFRSMYEDSDGMLEAYLKERPEEVENYNVYHKYENDPRITKVGDFMRRTSLDELPQIINVLRGEMSLIGPRPYMLNEKEKICDNIDMIMAVKPGITGLWQVSGRSDVDFHSRVDIDVYYTRNWSLWLDFVIFVKTIRTVLFRNGAS